MAEKQIKILFLINNLGVGGAENVFKKQIIYFKNNHFKTCLGVVNNYSITNNKEVINFNFTSLFSIKSYLRLLIFCKKNKINYIYATLDHAIFIARIIKIFYPQIKVIIRESGMADRKSIKIKLTDILFNFLTYKIIAVSKLVEKSLIKYQYFYRKKMVVINNGVEIIATLKDTEKILSNKKDEQVIFLNVGSMQNNNKGQMSLVEVFKDIYEHYPKLNLFLWLVGDGAQRPLLEKKVKEFNLNKVISFFGVLNHEKLNKVYQEADVFVLNSKKEGCPNVVLEAMSFALPVVTARVGGIDEMIEDQKTGLVFPIGNKLEMKKRLLSLIESKNHRLVLGRNGYNFIKHNLTWEQQNFKLKKLFVK